MFASITISMAEVPRSCRIRLVVYINDFCIANQYRRQAKIHAKITVKLLTKLEWFIDLEKSISKPIESFEYIGVHSDTSASTESLTQSKTNRIRQSLKEDR